MGRFKDDDPNKGYYQDVDEARFCHTDFDDLFFEGKKQKNSRNEASYRDPKYDEIAEKYNPQIRNQRRKFCEERHQIHAERRAQFDIDMKNGTYKDLPKTLVFCRCKNCGGGFIAKVADRKRGWARFCSKSCKAQ